MKSSQNRRSGSSCRTRRIIGGGTCKAQPLGVPVSRTSPGAILANVDNSEIVSAGLKTRLAVVSFCRRTPLTERRRSRLSSNAELLRLENRQPWPDRAEAAVALPLEKLRLWKLHVARTDVVCDRDRKNVILERVASYRDG